MGTLALLVALTGVVTSSEAPCASVPCRWRRFRGRNPSCPPLQKP